MKKKVYKYEAVIQPADKGGAYVAFPYDIREEFGKGRVKVHATFDSEPYDGSIVNMGVKNTDGSVCYIIGILKNIREKLGKQPGDTVSVTITERTT
jgi:bifunctional DNA-binding transcriptional regulator/antitoxin component of YhaV-PrlF toxin-antitoxin module